MNRLVHSRESLFVLPARVEEVRQGVQADRKIGAMDFRRHPCQIPPNPERFLSRFALAEAREPDCQVVEARGKITRKSRGPLLRELTIDRDSFSRRLESLHGTPQVAEDGPQIVEASGKVLEECGRTVLRERAIEGDGLIDSSQSVSFALQTKADEL